MTPASRIQVATFLSKNVPPRQRQADMAEDLGAVTGVKTYIIDYLGASLILGLMSLGWHQNALFLDRAKFLDQPAISQ